MYRELEQMAATDKQETSELYDLADVGAGQPHSLRFLQAR
jgi:hypothetical protein